MWLISVHGRHADWVRNLEANPRAGIRIAGRWHDAHATIHNYAESTIRDFNAYARGGPRAVGIDPALVRVQLEPSDPPS